MTTIPPIPAPDVYFKKTVALEPGPPPALPPLQFRVAQDLFSSHQVDVGSARLLRSLPQTELPFQSVLDVGCGYGVLGLALKAAVPTRQVHLVDRDALALAYTRQNAALNGLAGVEVYSSLGYDDVPDARFDLIISNLPGKAGDAVIASLLTEAHSYLNPGGWVAVVIVAPLAPLVEATLATAEAEILYREVRSGHAIYHYRFNGAPPPRPQESGLERGLYHRHTFDGVENAGLTFSVDTVRGLPEFDMLSFETQLLFKVLFEMELPRGGQMLVLHPGQGFAPIALWQLSEPDSLTLVDRDLLSLRVAAQNLARNGCPPERVTLEQRLSTELSDLTAVDLVAGVVREEEGEAALTQMVRQAAALLPPGGRMVLAGSSTAITRILKDLHAAKLFALKQRKRATGGRSALVLVR